MKRVWVVDDMIPVHELYSGPIPHSLDADLVRHLLEKLAPEDWEEPVVLDLCRTLCGGEYETTFFVSPESMLTSIRRGIVPPHAMIFDWEYPGSNATKNIEALEHVLSKSFILVQVYTHLGSEAIEEKLSALRAKFGTRLLPTRSKGDVAPSDLAAQVLEAWEGTIAGHLADSVRLGVVEAVERALIDLCMVPQKALSELAGGKAENLVHLVLSKVRDEIASEGSGVLDEIMASEGGAASSEALRQLLSVWYYFTPNDTRVRRGDLIEVDGQLGLVITPTCDLVRFSKKTGRVLTWLRCTELNETGVKRLRDSGFVLDDVGGSITAAHGGAGDALIILPNVPSTDGSRDKLTDYFVMCHAWESRLFKDAPTGKAEYVSMQGLRRRCTLADPFASAVISRVISVISSTGATDLPKGERARLKALLATPQGGG